MKSDGLAFTECQNKQHTHELNRFLDRGFNLRAHQRKTNAYRIVSSKNTWKEGLKTDKTIAGSDEDA
jgi:hypothetical protein